MKCFGTIIEQLISLEGTCPLFGRNTPCRIASCYCPHCAIGCPTTSPKELFDWLWGRLQTVCLATIATQVDFIFEFNGSQPDVAERHINNGSLYIASLGLPPLGLPADDVFWTAEPQEQSSKRAWEVELFEREHLVR